MSRGLVVLGLLLAVPLASALAPFGVGTTGVATQGSATTHDTGTTCAEVLTPMTLMMRIASGGMDDVLRLVAHDVTGNDPSATATLTHPAIVETTSRDSCAHFTVEGVHVESVAVYEVVVLRR